MKDAQQEMERLYTEWMAAAQAHDEDWYRNNTSDEFFYIHAGGDEVDTEGCIALANSSRDSEYHLRWVNGRRYGDVILAHGMYFGKGDLPVSEAVSQELHDKYIQGCEIRFSGSWIERDGKLECLHLQSTECTYEAD
jgi:hypothetical protein